MTFKQLLGKSTPNQKLKWRPCGDYGKLNQSTVPEILPLTIVSTDEILPLTFFNWLHTFNTWHKKMFESWLTQSIPTHREHGHKEHIEKTAIITPFRLFEFPNMTFGLHNVAQTFQKFMDQVLLWLDLVFFYIENILNAPNRFY